MKNKILNKCLNFSDFSRLFFCVFIFFVVFKTGFLFSGQGFYLSGFFNPFEGKFFYLADVFFLLSFLFFGFAIVFKQIEKEKFDLFLKFFKSNFFRLVFLFFLSFIFSLFFALNLENSIFYLFRFFQFLLVFFYLSVNFINIKTVMSVFVFSVFLSCLLGIFQFFNQGSLGIYFLGEPFLNLGEVKGISKIGDFLRAYGTFSHPNIFGAYVFFAILFIFYLFGKISKTYKKFLFIILLFLLLGLIFSFSRSVYLVSIVVFGIYFLFLNSFLKFKKKYVLLFCFFFLLGIFGLLIFNNLFFERIFFLESIQERIDLMIISGKMFFQYPFGVGIGNFTFAMQNFVDLKLYPWEFQPVHNLFLLSFNELGIWGGMILIFIFLYILKKGSVKALSTELSSKPESSFTDSKLWFKFKNRGLWFKSNSSFILIISIFILSMFDHYFLTLYQGQFLFWFLLGIIGNNHLKTL